ncbi:MAG: ATP-binding protein [Candidatus Zixiibacteriota bacterium]
MRIAFASGKGGTGKTTLATNMAAVLAAVETGISYIDADVEEPNGQIFLSPVVRDIIDVKVPVPIIDEGRCNLCGICADVCHYNAVAILGKKAMVFDSLCHSCGACFVLCPEKAISERQRSIGTITCGRTGKADFIAGCLSVGEALSPPLIRMVKNMISDERTAIIDAPPGTSCPVVEAVKGCDFVVLVTEPTPFGLNDLELAFGMLEEMHIKCGVVINRSDLGDPSIKKRIEEKGMKILMEIPFCRKTAEAYSNGVLNSRIDPVFADMMKRLYEIIGQEVNHG